MALTDKLTAIGDAIRSKTGGSDLLTLDEMPQEIQSIQTGGGGTSDTSLADSILDGTITSYSSDTLTEIKSNGFSGCPELTSVVCPNVSTLGRYCFDSCGLLTTISINWESVTKLPDYGFKSCSSLSSPTIYPNVTEVGQSCFDASGFTELIFPNLTKATSYGCFLTSSLSISQHLTKLTVGAKCTFGSSCFSYQGKLEALILSANEVSTLSASNAFANSAIAKGTGYIYVPSALLEQYKVATNWATYANQFRAIEDYPEICGDGGEA